MNTEELINALRSGTASAKDLKALEPQAQATLLTELATVGTSADKGLAKAAKKLLYQLKSAGLAVPEHKPQPEAPLTTKPASAEDELRAILSPMLGNGERLVLVPRPIKGGGLEMIQAVFNDELGIVELTVGELNRSQYRKQLKLMRDRQGVHAMDIPREEALKLLGHALWLNGQSGTPAPKEADSVVRHLGARPEPSFVELPPPQDGDATLAVSGGSLHDEPEVQAWLPPEEELRALGVEMDEVTKSPLYLDDAQRAAQLGRAFTAAAERFFTPARKRLYALRLWEMARYFDVTQRERRAEVARAEARRLFHDSPGLFSPFAQRLFEKVLMFTQTLQKGGAMPRPPGSLGAGRSAAPASSAGVQRDDEQKTPGGLILP